MTAAGVVSRASRRRGFALVAALWLMVALAAVSLQLALLGRQRRLAVANALEGARARGAAEAGVQHVRARLVNALPDAATPVRGLADFERIVDPWRSLEGIGTDTVALESERYVVAVRDLGATLSLNRASEDELQRFFAALPIDAAEAGRLAARIADWRDEDQIRRAQGAERDDYLAAGRPELPRDGDFASVDELRFVPDITTALLERVRPYLAVRGSGRVNANTAPAPVLLALDGMTPAAAAAVEQMQRARRRIGSLQELYDLLPPEARAPLSRASRTLMNRLTFETSEVMARSVGWPDGSPVRATTDAVLARASGAVRVTWWETR